MTVACVLSVRIGLDNFNNLRLASNVILALIIQWNLTITTTFGTR